MQFSEDKPTHAYVFHQADAHGVLINSTRYTHSLLITVEPHLLSWHVTCAADLTTDLLVPLFEGNPDLILIGTGAHPATLSHSLIAYCLGKQIGLETMTTPAAARTYNVLAHEGRRVAIGIII